MTSIVSVEYPNNENFLQKVAMIVEVVLPSEIIAWTACMSCV
jgi:hypothetical protein